MSSPSSPKVSLLSHLCSAPFQFFNRKIPDFMDMHAYQSQDNITNNQYYFPIRSGILLVPERNVLLIIYSFNPTEMKREWKKAIPNCASNSHIAQKTLSGNENYIEMPLHHKKLPSAIPIKMATSSIFNFNHKKYMLPRSLPFFLLGHLNHAQNPSTKVSAAVAAQKKITKLFVQLVSSHYIFINKYIFPDLSIHNLQLLFFWSR